jgi:hypothetical protein
VFCALLLPKPNSAEINLSASPNLEKGNSRVTNELGRLSSVPLREIWTHEANDFTPWLAKPENLVLLCEALQLGELDVQGTEVRVGSFAIDILARDLDDGVVIIENQLALTDHTHLGQILTYLAGQEGKATVVWIAERFREEHRAAIDWLNGSTIEGFNFFAVEVEVLRIGSSSPAPWFNVVGKPNAWSRNITRTARSGGDGQLDDRQRAYTAYWSGFGEFLQDARASFTVKSKPPSDYWCGFKIGRTGFTLGASAGFRDQKLMVELYINDIASKQAFDLLQRDRSVIESEFGGRLDWQRMDYKKACRIAIARTDMDPANEEQRPQQYAWLLEMLTKFRSIFSDRVKALQLDSSEDTLLPSVEEA